MVATLVPTSPETEHDRPYPDPPAAVSPARVIAVWHGAAPTGAALATARALAARLGAEVVLLGARSGSPEGASPGEPNEPLSDAVVRTGARLLVLPTGEPGHDTPGGASPDGERLAESVLASTRTPVLFVPPGFGASVDDGSLSWLGWTPTTAAAASAGQPIHPLRLLVALDPHVHGALPLVASLAQTLPAEVSLVRVVPRTAVVTTAGGGILTYDAALRSLQRASLCLNECGVPLGHIRLSVRMGEVVEQILAQAAREQASILVASRRHRPPLPGHAVRSISAILAQRSPRPTLVVPAN